MMGMLSLIAVCIVFESTITEALTKYEQDDDVSKETINVLDQAQLTPNTRIQVVSGLTAIASRSIAASKPRKAIQACVRIRRICKDYGDLPNEQASQLVAAWPGLPTQARVELIQGFGYCPRQPAAAREQLRRIAISMNGTYAFEERCWATAAACRLEDSSELMQQLCNMMKEKEPWDRWIAASAIRYTERHTSIVINTLSEAISDPDPVVRVVAADALWRADRRESRVSIPVLMRALAEKPAIVWFNEGKRTGGLPSHCQFAADSILDAQIQDLATFEPDLINGLRSQSVEGQLSALRLLEQWPTISETLDRAVGRLAISGDRRVREAAADVLRHSKKK